MSAEERENCEREKRKRRRSHDAVRWSSPMLVLVVAPQILIVLFLIYLFDNIIQLISLRSLWYYGGW
jgi:hypothetical protein